MWLVEKKSLRNSNTTDEKTFQLAKPTIPRESARDDKVCMRGKGVGVNEC